MNWEQEQIVKIIHKKNIFYQLIFKLLINEEFIFKPIGLTVGLIAVYLTKPCRSSEVKRKTIPNGSAKFRQIIYKKQNKKVLEWTNK